MKHNRRGFLAAIASLASTSAQKKAKDPAPPVDIIVGPGKDVQVQFFAIERPTMIGFIVDSLKGAGSDEAGVMKLRENLQNAGELSLLVTTKAKL